MNPSQIISLLGGTRQAARLLDRHPSTVSNWKDRGGIPAWNIDDILRVASENNIALSLEDLLSATTKRSRK